jgi:ATP-dependent protease Clp ATPase subunit
VDAAAVNMEPRDVVFMGILPYLIWEVEVIVECSDKNEDGDAGILEFPDKSIFQ